MIKKIFITLFAKKEKTRRWNWILRIGVMIFILAAVFSAVGIIMTMLANIKGFKFFGLEGNTVSSYSSGIACVLALAALFFIYYGKTKPVSENKEVNK